MWFAVEEEKPDIGTVIFKADDYYERLQRMTGMWGDNRFLYYEMFEDESPDTSEDEANEEEKNLFKVSDITDVPMLLAYLETASLKGMVSPLLLDFMWDLHHLYILKMQEFSLGIHSMSKKEYAMRENREKWARFQAVMEELHLVNLREENEAKRRKRKLKHVNMEICTRIEDLPSQLKGRKLEEMLQKKRNTKFPLAEKNKKHKGKDRFTIQTQPDNPYAWNYGKSRLYDRRHVRQVGKHMEFSRLYQKIVKALRFSKHEPVDWRTIKVAEIDKHRYYTDCWMAIKGRVYDITEYLQKHPGGSKVIMQGAGIDATQIFVAVHPFVIFYNELRGKQIGTLPNFEEHSRTQWEAPDKFNFFGTLTEWLKKPKNRYSRYTPKTSFTQNKTEYIYTVHFPKSSTSRETDWSVTIIKGFQVTVTKFVEPPYIWYGGFDLKVKVLDDSAYRSFSTDFNTLTVKIAKTYKVKVPHPMKDRRQDDGFFLSCYTLKEMYKASVVERTAIADGIKLYGVCVGMNKFIGCPIGCYVNLRILDETRPYTPVCLPEELEKPFVEESGNFQTLYFIVKEFKDGEFTSMFHYFPMKKIMKDVDLYVSLAMGNFQTSFLSTNMDVMLLIAGGTGISVMTRIIQEYIQNKTRLVGKNVILVYFVQHREDLVWKQVWSDLAKKYTWFHFFYCLTRVFRFSVSSGSGGGGGTEEKSSELPSEISEGKSFSMESSKNNETGGPDEPKSMPTILDRDLTNRTELYGYPQASKFSLVFDSVPGANKTVKQKQKAIVCGPFGFNHACQMALKDFNKHEEKNVHYFAA